MDLPGGSNFSEFFNKASDNHPVSTTQQYTKLSDFLNQKPSKSKTNNL
jgi:hypothetical protein